MRKFKTSEDNRTNYIYFFDDGSKCVINPDEDGVDTTIIAVKKAGTSVKKDIQSSAPKNTGKYGKSWTTKTTKETSNSLEVTVHSRNKYQLAHLLEFGHAKRGGGRTKAQPHIAPAEERGVETLEKEIEKALR